MANVCMLSSYDNPFNPFDPNEFKQWLFFENDKGFDPCSIVARLANITDDMSEDEIDIETERAIDAFIAADFSNNFIKLTKNNIKSETSNHKD